MAQYPVDLFKEGLTEYPDGPLPVPRIAVVRGYGSLGGFNTATRQYWTVSAIGCDGALVSSYDTTMADEVKPQVDKLVATFNWPVVPVRKVIQTNVFYEKDTLPEEDDG